MSGASIGKKIIPKSIRVAKAEASRDGNTMNVFIELRDVNYPGSTYTLTYEPASDLLEGIYYKPRRSSGFRWPSCACNQELLKP